MSGNEHRHALRTSRAVEIAKQLYALMHGVKNVEAGFSLVFGHVLVP